MPRRLVHRWLQPRWRGLLLLGRAVAELAAGLFGLVTLALMFSLGIGWFLLVPAFAPIRRLADLARRQARDWSGVLVPAPYDPGPPAPQRLPDGWYRYHRSLYRRPWVPAFILRTQWIYGDWATYRDQLWALLDPIVGAVLGLLAVVFGQWPLWLHARWGAILLGPTRRAQLTRRADELARAGTEAADFRVAELRRIERDLHDGAQARLVSMGMTLSAADELIERDPAAARAMLGRAQESAAKALTELRDLVRGIYPPVLAERGLADAVRALALDSPLDVDVRVGLRGRPEPAVESVGYFAVSEALTNAAKHAGRARATVDLRHDGGALVATVTDDGCGGADPDRGSGLRGIERRLAAFGGTLAVDSPAGGPTTVRIVVPPAPHCREAASTVMTRSELAEVLAVGLGSIALWPQGIVPMIFKLIDLDVRSWFLALYLPGPLQWPTIAVMIAAGLAGYVFAIRRYRQRRKDCQ